MKKIYKNILLLVSITAIFNSCETVDFGDINEDPNGPTSAVTSQLLTEAQKDISTITTSDTGILYMQHLTEGQ